MTIPDDVTEMIPRLPPPEVLGDDRALNAEEAGGLDVVGDGLEDLDEGLDAQVGLEVAALGGVAGDDSDLGRRVPAPFSRRSKTASRNSHSSGMCGNALGLKRYIATASKKCQPSPTTFRYSAVEIVMWAKPQR